MTAALSLTRRFVAEGRAVLLFSPFLEPLDIMSDLLTVAGLPHLVCDGRLSPRKRAEFARQFAGSKQLIGEELIGGRSGQSASSSTINSINSPTINSSSVRILLACSQSMAEGYNFPRCSRIIHLGLPWAMDTLLQSEDRGWRLNSVEDLHVFRLVSESSIDELMETQMQHKTATADLVIDGIIRRAPVVAPTPSDLLWMYHQSTPITL